MNDNFKEDIKAKGKVGVKWLKDIPKIIEKLEKDWDIKVGKPFDLYFNYVVSAIRSDGTNVVLKIVFPDDKQFQLEVDALRIFNSKGCVKLLETDKEHFTMLLEKAEPGVALDPWKDDNGATRVIASVIKKLGKPVPSQYHFADVKDFAKDISNFKQKYKEINPLPEYLVDKAEELIKHLIKSSATVVVNHGDLHHGNILSAKREPYLAIDPKGIIAEPAFETGAMLRNPYPELGKQPNIEYTLTNRIHILAEELGIEPLRIQQWGIAVTVLSAIWRVEEFGTHWDYALAIAQILNKIKI